METRTNIHLSPGTAIVIINIPPYGRVKLGDHTKTAFPELNKIINDLFEQVGGAPQDGFPSVNVANLLIEKYDGEIILIEYPDSTGIVY
jgi:hypothetical protein